jgi:hypothetical protein
VPPAANLLLQDVNARASKRAQREQDHSDDGTARLVLVAEVGWHHSYCAAHGHEQHSKQLVPRAADAEQESHTKICASQRRHLQTRKSELLSLESKFVYREN